MTNVYEGSVLGFTTPTEVISAAAQVQILAEIDKVIAAFTGQTSTTQVPGTVPDFDRIHPATAARIVTELTALKTAIDAAPTA